MIARSKRKKTIDKIVDAIFQIQGGYSLVMLTQTSLVGVRDPYGIRPLVIGKLNNSYVLSSETCAYFQFNYVAIFESNFEEQEVNFVEYEYDFNIREFDDIYKKYPDIEMNSFADSSEFDEDELTTYGFYDGQDHFIGPCKTRSGDYPFCLDILLPAYSLTKTISGTLGVAAYEKKYGSIKDLEVKDLLSFCTNKKWDDVTLELSLIHISEPTRPY